MRLTRVVAALVSISLSATACGTPRETPNGSVAGTWTLKTYNGKPLPYVAPPQGNAIFTATAGELMFTPSGSYSLHIGITRVANGSETTAADWDEVGTYTLTSEGLTMRPFDVPGTRFIGKPVSATVIGNTISLPQEGKTLTFEKK